MDDLSSLLPGYGSVPGNKIIEGNKLEAWLRGSFQYFVKPGTVGTRLLMHFDTIRLVNDAEGDAMPTPVRGAINIVLQKLCWQLIR